MACAARADMTALGIRAALDRLSLALARAAAAFLALRAWPAFGYARLEDLARERYGRSGRWLRDLAALGNGLAAAPRLAAALAGTDGGRPLGRVAATLIARDLAARVRAPDQADHAVAGWIAAGRRLSVRELRAAIRAESTPREARPEAGAGAEPGCAAGDAGDAGDADDRDADRVLVRLPVPAAVLAAFEETLELHRAVQGRGTSVTDFVEALVGEAQAAGLDTGEGYVSPLEHGTPEAQAEAALRRASDAWSGLPEPIAVGVDAMGVEGDARAPGDALPPGDAGAPGGGTVLARFLAAEAEAGRGDAVALDAQIRALVRLEDELESELGQVLATMADGRDWPRLLFAGVGHYAEERLGLSRSRAGERARLARALRSLPRVAAACAAGRISMEAAALIHRILQPSRAGDHLASTGGDRDALDAATRDALEAAWVDRALTTTIKRMRDEARALGRYRVRAWAQAHPGAGPHADRRPEPDGRPLADARPLTDAEWAASLRREVGTATRRIVALGLAAIGLAHAAPEPEPEPDVFQQLLPEPDEYLKLRLPPDVAHGFLAAIDAARVRLEDHASEVPWDGVWTPAGPDGAPSAWAARLAFVRGRRTPLWAGLLALLEDYAATWDTDGAGPERRDDSVLVRDGWRCASPGCSSRANLEVHHVLYRSRGGSDAGWNRVTLCRFHHQCGEHGGLLSVRGEAPLGLRWRLGRPDVASTWRAERRAD